MANNVYDAIVIGSGITGGWAAKELTEKGLKTIMLERGRNIEHVKDYPSPNKDPWDFPHRGKLPLDVAKNYLPFGVANQWITEANVDFWANETESPYKEVKPFNWFRGYQVGGRSLIWGRQSYRLSDLDFEANAKDGHGIDWPVRYKDIAPWYSYVEKFAGISGNRDGIAVLPDGEFMPPMEMNVVEKDLAERLKKQYNSKRHFIIGRVANITVPHNGRVNCQYQNKCWEGCNFGAYFSTQSATLPAAVKTGNLTLRPFSIVKNIIYDKDTQKAKGVEILDAETNKTYEYFAKIVFVCASALNSTWVLMNSATDIWEGGLGSSSGELGHNLMDHMLNSGAGGRVEGFEDKYVFGRRANGLYVPRFANIEGDSKKRDYIRGFGYQGGASRGRWSGEVDGMSVGGGWKDAISEPGSWYIGFTAFGEILPYHENKISLDKTVKDKWGLPVLAMDAEIKENEKKIRQDAGEEMKQMLESIGVKDVSTYDRGFSMGQGIHEMGTARMGHDPDTSVLNKYNQVWDAKNVFVTDGAFMTSASCVNPSLTYMAFTARAVDYAVSELKKGNL
ncbi:GMC oxidoreductase [Sphingobacterium spiritivorum]|uniref:GMC oxidoreductase n=1 Tax=Sphingobacterium spiritivorum TaxID=258 RepID=UPI003DA5F5E7